MTPADTMRDEGYARGIEDAARLAEQIGGCANTTGRDPQAEALGEDIADAIRALADRQPDQRGGEVEREAAEAIRSAFFTSVSGEKPHRYHLSLAYPTMEAMHAAEDAIKAWAKSVLEPSA